MNKYELFLIETELAAIAELVEITNLNVRRMGLSVHIAASIKREPNFFLRIFSMKEHREKLRQAASTITNTSYSMHVMSDAIHNIIPILHRIPYCVDLESAISMIQREVPFIMLCESSEKHLASENANAGNFLREWRTGSFIALHSILKKFKALQHHQTCGHVGYIVHITPKSASSECQAIVTWSDGRKFEQKLQPLLITAEKELTTENKRLLIGSLYRFCTAGTFASFGRAALEYAFLQLKELEYQVGTQGLWKFLSSRPPGTDARYLEETNTFIRTLGTGALGEALNGTLTTDFEPTILYFELDGTVSIATPA
jgi:hypothetical protein